MKRLFSKSLLTYASGVLAIIIATGGIISLSNGNIFVLLAVLFIEYIVLLIIGLHVYDKYIKPVEKATRTVDQLVEGNYLARIRVSATGGIGELSNKINALARNLSELTINEQLQAEQLTTVIDNTESGLVLIDEKGYIHLVNRKFLSMFGKTPKDYIGYLYYDVFDNEKVHETVQETFLYEKKIKTAITKETETEKNYLEIAGAPIFDEKHQLKGAVLVLYDITDLKNLEQMRKDFVANVSHELKTPITSIKGFAETLLDGQVDEAASREQFLSIIYEETSRLQLLIDDLLTLSQLERDGFELVKTTVDLPALVEEITPLFRQKTMKQQINFTAEAADHLTVKADKDMLKQVMINLLNNAISYTQAGGKVSLHAEETQDFIRIRVKDTGIGMHIETLPRIFERFYRVDKARSRNTGGTGLGLAIVKHITEVHGGKITVESRPDEGSLFSVYFPKEKQTSS